MALLLTRHNNLRVKANAWITYGKTKRTWFKGCLTYTEPTKTDANSKHGASTARREESNSKKCDIFATLLPSLYRIFLTNSYKFFYKSRNTRGSGKFKVNVLNYINKRPAKTDFYRGKRGRSSQFLAVLLHSSCERFFVHLFWHGNPKYFIYSGVTHA